MIGASLAFFSVLLKPSSKSKNKTEYRHKANIKKSYQQLNYIQSVIASGNTPMAFNTLKRMNAYLFEEFVLSAFEEAGATVQRSKSYSNDGGVDGVVKLKGATYLLQCKRYRNHITAAHVKKHIEICAGSKSIPVFVHTGKTGKGSRSIAREGGIIMISGPSLIKLIQGDISALKPRAGI
jgi:restriction system protein